jgi:secondary thiamine-phosphate synthase enzyme
MRHTQTELRLTTTADTDLLDLTPAVTAAVEEAAIDSGRVLVFVPGSTAAVTTIEYESGCLADLRRALERIAPRDGHYEHNARWGDGNGYSHLRAAFIGPSLAVPVRGGRPALGTWQQILLCDFDNKPRQRRVLVDVWGD